MIRIGEMAKICRTQVRTLRFYDQIGLLPADSVDETTGYRYYDPAKIAVYRQIICLKELGFSLEEIGLFLSSRENKRLEMYRRRKITLEEDIRRAKEKILHIDKACADPRRGMFPTDEQLPPTSFEDDSAAIGRWEYCGDVPEGQSFTDESSLIHRDIPLKSLWFLPGGRQVWMYFWTKGILYCQIPAMNITVPNTYRIFDRDGVTYMKINWLTDKCLYSTAQDCIRIYRRVDNCAHILQETQLYRDDIHRPFIPDPQAEGIWKAAGIIRDKNAFSPTSMDWDAHACFLRELEFREDGICRKLMRNGHETVRASCRYTAGYILNSQTEFAEQYEIRTLRGDDYLITEHKSGDYAYLGKVNCYFVFRRKTP